MWRAILEAIDQAALASGVRNVVLGGYGVLSDNRESTDRAFRQTWTEWHSKLEDDANRLVHEHIRLTALILLAALAGAVWRKKHFRLRRLIALLATASVLSVTVVGLFDWARPLFPTAVLGSPALMIKAFLATLAGIFIDQIVGFEPREVLQDR